MSIGPTKIQTTSETCALCEFHRQRMVKSGANPEFVHSCQHPTALEAMSDAAPNGRDYYMQTPSTFDLAQDQHQKRMHKLADVIRELNEIGEAL